MGYPNKIQNTQLQGCGPLLGVITVNNFYCIILFGVNEADFRCILYQCLQIYNSHVQYVKYG